jgi:hypothetical protein
MGGACGAKSSIVLAEGPAVRATTKAVDDEVGADMVAQVEDMAVPKGLDRGHVTVVSGTQSDSRSASDNNSDEG